MKSSVRLIREMIAALNAHDVERVVQCYAADYQGLDLSLASFHQGPGDVEITLRKSLQAFPDLHLVEHTLLTQEDHLVFVWTSAGTHRSTFAHIPPTEKRIVSCGTSLLWFRDGRIWRGLHIWDMAGMLRSMCLLPDLPEADGASQDTLLATFFDRL